VRGHGAHSHKRNGGNRASVSTSGCQNVFFVINATQPFAHLSCTDFDHFWKTDVNRFPHAYTGEKFPNFCSEAFPGSQNSPKYGTLGWGLCARPAAQMAQLWTMGIITGASQHPMDVPFVREFWWGTYGLGAISPPISPNFGDFTAWVDLIV